MNFLEYLVEAIAYASEEGDSPLTLTVFDGEAEIECPDGTILRVVVDEDGSPFAEFL